MDYVITVLFKEAKMESPIDIERLRRDLMNLYGKALFAGFDAALEDLIEVDKATEQALIEYANKEGIDIYQYKF